MAPLILPGSASAALASGIAAALGRSPGEVIIDRFPDGEMQAEIRGDVRGRKVYIVQSTSPPVAENLLELLFIADACRRAGAGSITAVVPYLGYARQDRRVRNAESIGARVVADLFRRPRFDRCLLVDLHSPPVEGFFDVPVVQLSALPLLARSVATDLDASAVVVAPDIGAAKRAEAFAAALRLPVALVHKTRLSGTEVSTTGIVGGVRKREAVIIDDMISTGATIEAAVGALRDAGFSGTITVAATHAVLTADAAARLDRLALRRLVTTDTVAPRGVPSRNGRIVSIAPLIAATIRDIEVGGEVGEEEQMEPADEQPKRLKKQVSLNESSEEELAAVDAIGREHAHEIVAYRQAHGPFHSLDDLRDVPGIEQAFISTLREFASVEGRQVKQQVNEMGG